MCRLGQSGQLAVDYRHPVQDLSPGEATLLNFYSNSVLYVGEYYAYIATCVGK